MENLIDGQMHIDETFEKFNIFHLNCPALLVVTINHTVLYKHEAFLTDEYVLCILSEWPLEADASIP